MTTTESYHNRPPLLVIGACPDCGAGVTTRRNRAHGDLFIGCRAYPRCGFTAPFVEREQDLAERIELLEAELAVAQDELDDLRATQALLPAETVAKELRAIIVYTHPDRWPNNALAHEATARLTALRDRLRVSA